MPITERPSSSSWARAASRSGSDSAIAGVMVPFSTASKTAGGAPGQRLPGRVVVRQRRPGQPEGPGQSLAGQAREPGDVHRRDGPAGLAEGHDQAHGTHRPQARLEGGAADRVVDHVDPVRDDRTHRLDQVHAAGVDHPLDAETTEVAGLRLRRCGREHPHALLDEELDQQRPGAAGRGVDESPLAGRPPVTSWVIAWAVIPWSSTAAVALDGSPSGTRTRTSLGTAASSA